MATIEDEEFVRRSTSFFESFAKESLNDSLVSVDNRFRTNATNRDSFEDRHILTKRTGTIRKRIPESKTQSVEVGNRTADDSIDVHAVCRIKSN